MPPLFHPRLHIDNDSDDDSVPQRHPRPRQRLNYYDSGDTESESDSDSESDNDSDSESESDSDSDDDFNNDEPSNHGPRPLHPALARPPQSRHPINPYTHLPTSEEPDAPSGTPPGASHQHSTPPSQVSTTSHTSRNPSTLNPHNLLHNQPSGDALDDYPAPVIEYIRIYFQNVNCLRTSANGLDILDFFCQIKDIDAAIFGINEINQDTQHPYIHQLLHKHQHQVWDNSKLQYASSKLDTGNIRKPGRTLLGITGSLSSRVIDNFSDDMGRWCGVTLLGKQAKKYTIICAYQVPLVTGTSGPSTSHTQQLLML
jgi:hypothetical protein